MHLSQKGVPRIWLNQWVAESRSAKIEQATGQVQTANIKTRFQLKTRWRNVFLVVVETWTWLARAASTRISSSSPAPCPWGSSRTPRWRSLWWVLRWKQQGRWEILFLKQNVPSVSVHWILKYYMVCTCTWMGEILCCSCLTALRSLAWVLLSKICIPYLRPLHVIYVQVFIHPLPFRLWIRLAGGERKNGRKSEVNGQTTHSIGHTSSEWWSPELPLWSRLSFAWIQR